MNLLYDRDAFLVLACDGIWDVMSNQQVADFMAEQLGYTCKLSLRPLLLLLVLLLLLLVLLLVLLLLFLHFRCSFLRLPPHSRVLTFPFSRVPAYGGPVGGVSTQAAATACDALLQLCLEKGSVDNISAVVVVLGGPVIISGSNRPSPRRPSGCEFETSPDFRKVPSRRPSASNTKSAQAAQTAQQEVESDSDDGGSDLPIYDVHMPHTSLGGVFSSVADSPPGLGLDAIDNGEGGLDVPSSPLNLAAKSWTQRGGEQQRGERGVAKHLQFRPGPGPNP
ncbi:hypothetical protein B484DRAFT_126425 [Ochromonadaceae sp. CCMP2298]|nr:hypothetical protein B484DRAFT_126425 [Ochromonadaceae sp. CCMP2298]